MLHTQRPSSRHASLQVTFASSTLYSSKATSYYQLCINVQLTVDVCQPKDVDQSLPQADWSVALEEWPHLLRQPLLLPMEENADTRLPPSTSSAHLRKQSNVSIDICQQTIHQPPAGILRWCWWLSRSPPGALSPRPRPVPRRRLTGEF